MKKRILAGTLAAMMSVSSMAAIASETEKELDLFVNQTQVSVDAFEDDGKVMIPVRAVCEALDMEVAWNDEAKRVEITKLPLYVTFTPFEDGYTFARTAPLKLGTAPQLLGDGITYVPAEFFGEIIPAECEVTESGVKITYAEQAENGEQTENNAETEKIEARKVLVTEIGDGQITVYDPQQGEVVVNIAEETVITDSKGEKAGKDAVLAGKLIEIEYAPAMTLSLPPIANAVSITVLEAGDYELMETQVQGVEEEGILVGNSDKIEDLTLLVKTEDFTALDAEGNAISEIKAGSKITAIVSMTSTMSIPPQRNVFFIRVTE